VGTFAGLINMIVFMIGMNFLAALIVSPSGYFRGLILMR
jgi:hypothetical protein